MPERARLIQAMEDMARATQQFQAAMRGLDMAHVPGPLGDAVRQGAAALLQTEYMAWRLAHRLEPTERQLRRLRRWTRLARRHGLILSEVDGEEVV